MAHPDTSQTPQRSLLACVKSKISLGMSAAAFSLQLCFVPPHLVSLAQTELQSPVLQCHPPLGPLPMLGGCQVTAAALCSSPCLSFQKSALERCSSLPLCPLLVP